MRFKHLLLLQLIFCLTIMVAVNYPASQSDNDSDDELFESERREEHENEQEEEGYDEPQEFIKFHNGIRTRDDETSPGYKPGYLILETKKAREFARARRSNARVQSNGVLAWTERGPANVPGRMRGLIIDPDDGSKNTWYAGSVSGGVWKTTNGGQSWVHITPDLPNLATSVLAMAESNHNVIYLGTGEGFSNIDQVRGNGIFKSTDRGSNWLHLSATTSFGDVMRIIVDPGDEDVMLAATTTGIYRSVDGGSVWTKVYASAAQDIRATPGNFNIQYAAQNAFGVIKSIDGGQSWNPSKVNMKPLGRSEIAIAPTQPNRIAVSAEGAQSGGTTDLYLSNDAGATWTLVNASINNTFVDFLGQQGWYDNTLAFDPFDPDVLYVGGVGVYRVDIGTGSTTISSYSLEENGTTGFLNLVNFGASQADGRLEVTTSANASVAVKWGAGRTQKAHRFLVPDGATSGVPDNDYSFEGYVDVPFEVWLLDADGNDVKQLMLSFRDQDRNGIFNLLLTNTSGPATEQSREYIFIHTLDYSASTPSPAISANGGHVQQQMYFIWPTLLTGTWNPASVPASTLNIKHTGIPFLNTATSTVADVYGAFDDKNDDVHPDQHNLTMVPMTASTYKIVLANDGGIFVSNTSAQPGVSEGDWTMAGLTLNTTQFYGADKRPGADAYMGGTQDNGTWRSDFNEIASASTDYAHVIGGDGFEVLWHNYSPNLLIGGSQYNGFARSTNGGSTWTNATSGLSGDAPFISKLANSKDNPDVIFTVSSAGVFRSENFGQSWTLTPITVNWGAQTFLDVEVSRANANIVWAGSAMNGSRNLHVSTDGGKTFQMTNNYTEVALGRISKIASHPHQPHTAYAIFSFANTPKVLRTTNLGQTWQDISGFGTNPSSSTGFPNVAAYCLYVRPDNPDIIWVGTEIGIVESLDNGATWALLDEFPNVAVWEMKGQDNQVVIATHGRGIWTATIDSPQSGYVPLPEIVATGTSPQEQLMIRVKATQAFDSVRFFISDVYVGTHEDLQPGSYDFAISGLSTGSKNIKLVAYLNEAPFTTPVKTVNHLDILAPKDAHADYFNQPSTFPSYQLSNLSFQSLPSTTTGTNSLHTNHPYTLNTLHQATLLHPIRVSAANAMVYYSDIAIVEPGQDSVTVQATKNGLDWFNLTSPYDADANSVWLAAFQGSTPGTRGMFEHHSSDLSQFFDAGDSILVRFSVHSNTTVNAWGWALDYVTIQQEPTGVERPVVEPLQFKVFPNPVVTNATVEFTLKQSSPVEVSVIDMSGKEIIRQALGMRGAGTHTETLLMSAAPAGQYVVRLQTRSGQATTKLTRRSN